MKDGPAGARVLIVVPVFNNEGAVSGVLAGVAALGLPVLVVDDGSTDGSASALDAFPVHRIRFPENRGKGLAIRRALSWAEERGFSHIITLDADGQHSPGDIPRFLDKIREAPEAVIIGKRDFGRGVPGGSRFGRRWSNLWIRIASGVATPDSQSGFRAYPVRPLSRLKYLGSRYEFEVEVLVRAVWAGLPLEWVDVSVRYFPPAERVSHFRPLKDNARISWIYTLLVLRRMIPFRRRSAPRGSSPSDSYGNRAGHAVFRWVIGKLGVRPAYGVLVPVIAYYVLFRPSAVRAAAPYLRRRFPGRGGLRMLWLAYRHYFAFGRCLIDQAATNILGREGLRIDFPDADALRELSEEGRGLVLVVSHVGVWHSALSTLDYLKRPVYLNWRRERHSQSMGLTDFRKTGVEVRVISPDGFLGGIPELSLALTHGRIVAVMGDRGHGSSAVRSEVFLGTPAGFPILPYHLAFTTNSDLVVFLTARTGPRRIFLRAAVWRMTEAQRELGKDRVCRELLQWYVGELERLVRDHPFMWYNFHDIWMREEDIPRQGRDVES